ncbi:uncharacterized protein LOC126481894 [Schistocerca serialis cubense]|uniref:uncharacterized protein LOC126481894 n=1 Tax=Schistocerca serialis cubense TaxID=2023355 RepID=UPI00214F5AE8|nr:uncharacterized protein LOC126481894 [Schistocerca serialis cubense]
MHHPNSMVNERTCWALLVLAAAVGAAVLAADQLAEFSRSPTRTLLQARHLPVGSLPFPAVTLCPAVKTNRTLASQLLTRWLEERGLAEEASTARVEAALAALSLQQFPYFKRLAPFVRAAGPLAYHLRDLNVTDFMLKVLPSCRSFFHLCSWLRQRMNCCEMFRLLPTENGYCYSFNTVPAKSFGQCDIDAWRRGDPSCRLLSAATAGVRSALLVALAAQDPGDALPDGMQRDAGVGVRLPSQSWMRPRSVRQVVVHSPLSYPDPGARGALLSPAAGGPVLRFSVTPQVTHAADGVRGVSWRRRGCLLSDEWPQPHEEAAGGGDGDGGRRAYDVRLCLAICRGQHIRRRCGCMPYFYGTTALVHLFTWTF